MKKKVEWHYLKHEWTKLKAHLKSFDHEGKQDSLHQFRIQVKKVRAFLIMVDREKKTAKLEKQLKPVRQIFKAAGEIRNAYINLEMIKDHQLGSSPFVRIQRHLMKTSAAKLRSATNKHIHDLRKTRRSLKKKLPHLSNQHVTMYYQQQLEQIALNLKPPHSDETLHACRKQLKILIYNYALVKPVLNLDLNEDYLEQVQITIGDWHDKQIAIDLFCGEEVGDADIAVLLKKERIKLKRKITLLVKNFYMRATTVEELSLEKTI
ncbi:CHAD domain-containing protein [Arcticibacter eurypsychrophilus]|uniref:CHAD domain-containing protein n=1 Tax=Arcticibacter eurypsychrophilus TaxID=1434752 RepID=UPI00084DECD7|nr:CHAD domain-containing protein [Arcticibacter eurypsychrophilus]